MECFNNYYIFVKLEYIKAFFVNHKVSIFNLNVTPAQELSSSKDINAIVWQVLHLTKIQRMRLSYICSIDNYSLAKAKRRSFSTCCVN